MMRTRCSILICTVLLLTSTVSAFASNFADTYGYSPEGMARGNAMTAVASDGSAVYYNIAGLGKQSRGNDATVSNNPGESAQGNYYAGDIFGISYLRTIPVLYKKSDNSKINSGSEDQAGFGVVIVTAALSLKHVLNLPVFISTARIGLGVGIVDDGSLMKINELGIYKHNFIRYGRDAQMAQAKFGLGLGFLEDAFGIGAGASAYVKGNADANLGIVDPARVQNGEAVQVDRIEMNMRLKPSALAGLYCDAGRLVSALDGLILAASYRQESSVSIQPFRAVANLSGLIHMNLILSIFEYYSPHIITTGLSYTVGKLKLSSDVEYHLWSRYKVSLGIQEGEDLGLYELPEARNIFVFRGGIDYAVLPWLSILGGFYYQPAIFSEDAMNDNLANFLDNDRYVGSLGARFKLPNIFFIKGDLAFTLGYQFQYLSERSVTKNNASITNMYYDYGARYRYGGMSHTLMAGLILMI